MSQTKLPNVNVALALALISYVCCCFSAGIGGLILSVSAIILIRKDQQLYSANPEQYNNYSTLKVTRVISIIALVLSVFATLLVINAIVEAGGWDMYIEQQTELYENFEL
jgi:hypothetical protein